MQIQPLKELSRGVLALPSNSLFIVYIIHELPQGGGQNSETKLFDVTGVIIFYKWRHTAPKTSSSKPWDLCCSWQTDIRLIELLSGKFAHNHLAHSLWARTGCHCICIRNHAWLQVFGSHCGKGLSLRQEMVWFCSFCDVGPVYRISTPGFTAVPKRAGRNIRHRAALNLQAWETWRDCAVSSCITASEPH